MTVLFHFDLLMEWATGTGKRGMDNWRIEAVDTTKVVEGIGCRR